MTIEADKEIDTGLSSSQIGSAMFSPTRAQTGHCWASWTLSSLSWKLVSTIKLLLSFQKLICWSSGFAVTAVVALILNLSLPYDVEEAAELVTEPDVQPAAFTEHDSEAGMSKEIPAVEEKKVDDLDV